MVALFGLILSVVMWGSSYSFIKFMFAYMGPISLAFLRSAISVLIFFAIILARGHARVLVRDALVMAVLGIVGLGANVILFHLGLNLTTTSHASLMTSTSPIITSIISWLFLNEIFNLRKGAGVLLSFAGVSLTLIEGTSLQLSASVLRGDLIMLTSAFFWSVYTVVGKPVLDRYPPLVISTYTMFFGTIFMFPFAYNEGLFQISLNFGIKGWAVMAFLSLFVTALAVALWYNGLKRLAPAEAMVFMNLVPVVAAIIAIVFLGEKITPLFVAGLLMVIGGVCMVAKKAKGRLAVRDCHRTA